MKNKSVNYLGINLFMINAFIFISFSLYTPFLSSYYTKAGISAVNIGLLLTIAPITAIFIQPIWAILSDKTGRKKDVLSLVAFGSAVAIFCYYIGNSFRTFLIATVLLSIFTSSLVPLNDAITIQCTKKYQMDFSKIRMGGTIGYAIVVIFAGYIVKQKPSLQFVLGSMGFLLLFVFIRLLPKNEVDIKRNKTDQSDVPLKPKSKVSFFAIFESKQIIFMLLFALVSQIGLSFNYSFIGVYMTNLGLSEGIIGVINCISAFSELPVLLLINWIMRKFDSFKVIIFSCLLVCVRIFTITGGNVYFIILSQIMHGFTFMTIYYSCAIFISQNVKPENQSKGQSALSIVQGGVASIIGNIVGGLLVDSFGLNNSYRIMSLIVLIGTVSIALFHFRYQRKIKLNTLKQMSAEVNMDVLL
jgi:oligosaccharide:H+ symporter